NDQKRVFVIESDLPFVRDGPDIYGGGRQHCAPTRRRPRRFRNRRRAFICIVRHHRTSHHCVLHLSAPIRRKRKRDDRAPGAERRVKSQTKRKPSAFIKVSGKSLPRLPRYLL